MENLSRRKICVALAIMLIFSCTGCAGMSWEDMKSEGKSLLEQGENVNQQLASDAAEVNSELMTGNINLQAGDGWKSVFEKENLRIQYASTENLENKITIEDSDAFIEQLSLEQWELSDDFPADTESEVIFFIQQPVSNKMPDGKYKNIANVRCFPEEKYLTITIGSGLIDLSDEFELQDNEFSSVYRVPEECVNYLLKYK